MNECEKLFISTCFFLKLIILTKRDIEEHSHVLFEYIKNYIEIILRRNCKRMYLLDL